MSEEAILRRRSVARALVVGVLTSITLAFSLPDIVLPWHPMSIYGFHLKLDGTISTVVPGYAAADAGIVAGDTIDLKTSAPDVRAFAWDLYAASSTPGNPVTVVVRHGDTPKTVTLAARVQQRSSADNISDVVLVASECLFILIASALVLLRPSRTTWAFYIYGISTSAGSVVALTPLPFGVQVAFIGYFSAFTAVGAVAFIVFALRFPSDRVSGWTRYVEAVIVPVAMFLAAANVYVVLAPVFFGVPTASMQTAVNALLSACFAAGVAAIVWKYATSVPEERQRIKWVIFGLVVGFGISYVFVWFIPNPSVWQYNLLGSASVLFPITLAYAVVRHRVIDVNFIVSRTLVYGTITALVIVVFGVIDWFFNSYLSLTKAGTAAEIASAIGLGFWLKALHGRVDTFVDAVFFRRRHEAEVRLRRLANALPHASSIDAVAETVVDRTADALDLTSAAIFLKQGADEFVRVRAVGWVDGGADRLSADDLLVLQLSAEQQPLALQRADHDRESMPRGPAHPSLAVPVTVRNELRAIVLYGPHRRGDDLDPDEVSTLSALAVGASAALDHAEAARLRRQMEESTALAKEVEAMRIELTKLRAALAT